MRYFMFIVIVILLWWIRIEIEKPAPKCDCDKVIKQNEKLKKELEKWEDHAIRMKRIAGVPDTISWSYIEKVKHPVNTYNLTH